MPVHCKTNDNECWFTVKQNRLLEIDEIYYFKYPYLILTNQQACKGNGALRDKLYYNYLTTALGITTLIIMLKLTKSI